METKTFYLLQYMMSKDSQLQNNLLQKDEHAFVYINIFLGIKTEYILNLSIYQNSLLPFLVCSYLSIYLSKFIFILFWAVHIYLSIYLSEKVL